MVILLVLWAPIVYETPRQILTCFFLEWCLTIQVSASDSCRCKPYRHDNNSFGIQNLDAYHDRSHSNAKDGTSWWYRSMLALALSFHLRRCLPFQYMIFFVGALHLYVNASATLLGLDNESYVGYAHRFLYLHDLTATVSIDCTFNWKRLGECIILKLYLNKSAFASLNMCINLYVRACS